MKRQGVIWLLVGWICCMVGCALVEAVRNAHSMNQLHFDLDIDDRTYTCCLIDHYKGRKHEYTTIRATLFSKEGTEEYRAGRAELEEMIKNGEELTLDFSVELAGRVLPPIHPNHFQIIDKETYTVLFETPLEGLGVCVVWKDKQFSEEKLKEAMATVIREHVNTQHPETEE